MSDPSGSPSLDLRSRRLLGPLDPPWRPRKLSDLLRPDFDTTPQPPQPPPGDRPEPEPGSHSGGFGGETVLVVEDPRPLAGSPTDRANGREIASFNVEANLADGWNTVRPFVVGRFEETIESIPRDELPGSVRRLYDAQAELGGAGPSDALQLHVSPRHRMLFLFHVVPGHRLRFKADVRFLPDPRITVDLGLGIALDFATDGEPADGEPEQVEGSVWLKSLGLRLMGPRAKVSKNVITAIAEFIRRGNFAAAVERRFAGSTADFTEASSVLVRGLRDALRDARRQGHSTDNVVPWYDEESHKLLLRLLQPSPFDRPADDSTVLGR